MRWLGIILPGNLVALGDTLTMTELVVREGSSRARLTDMGRLVLLVPFADMAVTSNVIIIAAGYHLEDIIMEVLIFHFFSTF